VEVNHSLEAKPGLVNHDPYGEGWVIAVVLSNPAELDLLLSTEEYQTLVSCD